MHLLASILFLDANGAAIRPIHDAQNGRERTTEGNYSQGSLYRPWQLPPNKTCLTCNQIKCALSVSSVDHFSLVWQHLQWTHFLSFPPQIQPRNGRFHAGLFRYFLRPTEARPNWKYNFSWVFSVVAQPARWRIERRAHMTTLLVACKCNGASGNVTLAFLSTLLWLTNGTLRLVNHAAIPLQLTTHAHTHPLTHTHLYTPAIT